MEKQARIPSNEGSVKSISAEAEIQRRMRDVLDARERGDLDRVMAFYAPDVVAFDCPPKLRLRGREEYRRSFDKWSIQAFRFPIRCEVREQRVLASGELAVVHELMNVKGTFKDSGEEASAWVRHTATWRKTSGEWLIAHEHFSVPIDENLHALMDLPPDQDREI